MSNPLKRVKLNKIFYFYYLFFKPNLKKSVIQILNRWLFTFWAVFKQLGFNFILRPSFFWGGGHLEAKL